MYELKNVYTLGEALKLYALLRMDNDIQVGKSKELQQERRRGR